jgi:predicted ATP-grasp superfamily ATP-dependent carboligase
MRTVLVLDANQRSALAIIRSLGRQGLRVLAGDQSDGALGAASRYAATSVRYADPATQPLRFVAEVAALVRQHRIDMVVPATDLTTMLLVSDPERLLPAMLVAPPVAAYEALTNKQNLLELARQIGVPAPDTRVATSAVEIESAAGELGYPLILKPARSRYLHADRIVSTGVQVVPRPEALRDVVSRLSWLADIPCLAQRFIPGHGAGIFALCGSDGPQAWFAHRRIREKPPSGGVSVLCESAPTDSTLQRLATRLLAACGWVGVAMIEFRVTPEGSPYLMEVNGRFWGSLQLAIDSGVDFPWLACRGMSGARIGPPASYIQGRRLRWLLGDVDNLILQLRSADLGLGGKARATGRFLGTFFDVGCRQEVFRWSDPGPGVREVRRWVGELVR